MPTHTDNDSQLTRLQALKNEVAAMTPAQKNFINGELPEAALLFGEKSATKFELREQERRLDAFKSHVESRISETRHKVDMQTLDLSSQARSIDALSARVRQLESVAPVKEILVIGLAGVFFVSLIAAVANAAADPV
jgi:predicted  nucleic acid-binding Zn-ribbon protein